MSEEDENKGKEKCEEPIDVIPTLIALIDHHNLQVRTFIHGLLYSLMFRKKLREEALNFGLKKILE